MTSIPTADAWDGSEQPPIDMSACPSCLRESCEGDCDKPVEAAPSRRRLHFRTAAEIIAEPPPVEIVEGLAFADRVSVVVSESGVGKTFVMLSLAATVGAGVSWLGRRDIKHGSVAYLSFEGDAFSVRLRALKETQGYTLEHLHVLQLNDPLSPLIDRDRRESPSMGEMLVCEALTNLREQLAATSAPPLVLVVIDTVRASMAGSEDSSTDVSAYLRAVRRVLSVAPGAAAILVHHAGWQDGDGVRRKRERGSSAFRGNVDGTAYLEAGDYDRDAGTCELTLRTLKVRDADLLPPLSMIRRRVELADAVAGDLRRGPLTSCVIDADRRTRADREADAVAEQRSREQHDDLLVLKTLNTHSVTSKSDLRTYAGVGTSVVDRALARCLDAGWVQLPPKKGQPYIVTDAGRAALDEVTS